MASVISSFHAFEEKFRGAKFMKGGDRRLEALKRYFERGGVISVDSPSFSSWPRLSYPSKRRVKQQIDECRGIRALFEARVGGWKKERWSASYSGAFLSAKKFSDSLYWKHLVKKATDSDYRADACSVKLPVEMVSHGKYRAMVDMFVNNPDYRKQLAETVKNSVVYKSNRLARHASEVSELRKGVSEAQISDFEKKIAELDRDIAMLSAMHKWAK